MTEEEILRYWMFRARDLIQIADSLPFVPTYLRSLNMTTFRPITTTEVKVYTKNKRALSLVQTTERGGPIPQDMPEAGQVKTMPTFRLAKGMTLHSHELQDVVMFGEGSVRARVATELAERFSRIDAEIGLTEENMLMGMIQGFMPDADGTELLNYFTEFGVTPMADVSLDFNNWDIGELRQAVNGFQREMAREMGGLPVASPRWMALCGDGVFDALVTSNAVKELYIQHAGARDLENMGQAYSAFPFAGFNWVNYRGTDDGAQIKIPDNEVRFFPVGVPGLYLDVRAPAEDFRNINRRGRRRYPVQVADRDRFMWIKNEMYTYPAYICTRPRVLRKGVLA